MGDNGGYTASLGQLYRYENFNTPSLSYFEPTYSDFQTKVRINNEGTLTWAGTLLTVYQGDGLVIFHSQGTMLVMSEADNYVSQIALAKTDVGSLVYPYLLYYNGTSWIHEDSSGHPATIYDAVE